MGQSLVNPFDSSHNKDFNFWYVVMGLFAGVYGTMAWQNRQGFNSAALNPHEGRMAGVLNGWRGFGLGTTMLLLALASMTFLHDPAHAALIQQHLDKISDRQTAEQMRLPLGLAAILPAGIKGCFVGGRIDGHHRRRRTGAAFLGQHLFSGRGASAARPIVSPRIHILLLRLSIIGVAIFAYVFGALSPRRSICRFGSTSPRRFLSAGRAWRSLVDFTGAAAPRPGAWIGLILGSSLSFLGIFLRQPDCIPVFREVATASGFVPQAWIDSVSKISVPTSR